ncbi:hypothetical protein [Janthinobacterium violaceinigrum]|uniref:Uncharacterized protein n=1 Tax=Janthinobacterium violaceinigrum TaxID=2654252 RepID=A0A6I1I5X9_9BURK|nr:hypothetical protein [Janthinobacterium violaceinigrum]KAB8066305.1 hypothetical protein GCN75_03690 [Janthinobacterium violaceinigrum]
MSDIESFQFFVYPAVDEGLALRLLGDLMGVLVESTDLLTERASAFAQVSCYSEGFEQGFLISWRRETAREIVQNEVLGQLSSLLKISALLEPSSESERWWLFNPNGLSEVNVRYLSDGIEVEAIE